VDRAIRGPHHGIADEMGGTGALVEHQMDARDVISAVEDLDFAIGDDLVAIGIVGEPVGGHRHVGAAELRHVLKEAGRQQRHLVGRRLLGEGGRGAGEQGDNGTARRAPQHRPDPAGLAPHHAQPSSLYNNTVRPMTIATNAGPHAANIGSSEPADTARSAISVITNTTKPTNIAYTTARPYPVPRR